ncbi:Isoprenyl transferase [Nymphon striatum]|nr:Isoprenyl transferase [Nymphon striatum]
MDGNGRWAQARGMPRTFGHKAGVEAVRRTVRNASELNIKHLTLYAFSSENWSRPASEVSDLLGLLKLYIRGDLADLTANGVCIRIIGSRVDLKPDILELIETAENKTAHNTKLFLNIAFNYGGRDEIVRAVQTVIDQPSGPIANGEKITADHISQAMDTSRSPDPDFIIRTSGEMRISNFLLWQIAYAEFVFLDCMWPDFDMDQFRAALEQFRCRNRRFGGVDTKNVLP